MALTIVLSLLYLKGLNTFGSGEWYAFAYNNDDWELKKFDSEDDALSLCSFKSNYIWTFFGTNTCTKIL